MAYMQYLLLLTLVLLLPLSSGAASYSWTDPAGTMHFTDDIGAVPPKYRTKALRQVASEDTAQTPATPGESKVTAPAAAELQTGLKPAQQAGPAGSATTPATKYGDRTASAWQGEFRQLDAELKRIERARTALKEETGEGNRLLSKQQIVDINARNQQLNNEYEATRLRFNQLVEQANKAGLPPEFSQ